MCVREKERENMKKKGEKTEMMENDERQKRVEKRLRKCSFLE